MTAGSPAAIVAALLLAAGCGGTPDAATPTPEVPVSRRVVIISVDGLRPDALQQAVAPNIVALAHRGAFTFHARTILPTITLPSHASMLSGFPPAQHGLTWNEYRPDLGSIRVPTVFARAHEAGLRTVVIVGKRKLIHLNVPGTVDSFQEAHGDADAAARAAAQARSFDLMFVHLPDTDLAGHASGWMSPDYMAALGEADQAVGRIVSALPTDATVIVTADHGGHGYSHGTDQLVDQTIPWIMAGPDVAAAHEVTAPVSTMDTAATALSVLRLSLPAGAPGRPVAEAFRAGLLVHSAVRGSRVLVAAPSPRPVG